MTDFVIISTHPIKKSDLGFHGNLFGGKLLAWLDAAGAAYAMEVCDSPRMVTVKIDECVFKKPAKEGQLLKILSTNIKFVRIDENGDPIPISDRVKSKYGFI
jgi:acyl-CoA thioesterase YciA